MVEEEEDFFLVEWGPLEEENLLVVEREEELSWVDQERVEELLVVEGVVEEELQLQLQGELLVVEGVVEQELQLQLQLQAHVQEAQEGVQLGL